MKPRALLWLPPLSFLVVFFFYPFARILFISLKPSLAVESDALRFTSFAFSEDVFSVLRFTFLQATLSTLLTLALGLPAAYLFARFDFRGKSFLRALTAVPFMLPTVVVAAGFNALLGARGWLSFVFPHSSFQFVGTLGAILVAHVFYNATIVIRIVGAALARLDPRLEQTARTLGANQWNALWRITLPLLKPALYASILLVFLFDFTSFGVVLLLGNPSLSTLEVEIYIQAVKRLNLPLAAWLSLIQLVCTLAFSILYTRLVSRGVVQTAPRSAESNLRKPKTLSARLFVSAFCVFLFAFFILPLISIPLRSVARIERDRAQRDEIHYGLTSDYYSELFINRRDSVFYVPPIRATINSLGYAIATVILSLLFGFPAASALARPTKLERVLDPLLILPLGASAVTLGLGFIVAFPRLLASPFLVPLAHTLIALPFVIRTLQPALASIPERLRHAATVLGATPFQVWLNVDFPILSRATLSAATFAFTVSLGEFGAAILLSRPEYPTIPVAIALFLSQAGARNYGQAMAMATLLLVVTTLGILLIEKLRLPNAGEF